MADIQQTLVYINEENIEEAKFMSRSFINEEIRTRAYINTLGAEVIKNYIASEGIDVGNLHNIHSISKVLENNDIADILLPNIHIDVRVVFDKEQIFVPKSHFEKNILPDIYAVVKFDEDFKTAEFLGYFKPEIIDKNATNGEYYFVTEKQLISTSSFIKTIKEFVGKAPRNISEQDFFRGRELAVKLNDHNLTNIEEKELFELLLLSDELRESVLEFDNFETLSYSASSEVVKNIENDTTNMQIPLKENETEDIALTSAQTDLVEQELTEINETALGDDLLETPTEFEIEDVADETKIKEPVLETEEILSETDTIKASESNQKQEESEVIPQEVHAVKMPKDTMSVDAILDRTIAAIDQKPEDIEDKKANLANNIVAALDKAAAGGAIAGGIASGIGAAAAAEETIATAETAAEVSENAIKLAAIAGESNIENETNNDTPVINKMNNKETLASITHEQNFEHETIDMDTMDVVNEGNLIEDHTEALSDMETLIALEGGINPEDEFVEMQGISDSEVVDLPMTDYTINDDGTSPMDMYNVDLNSVDEAELLDMPPLEHEDVENIENVLIESEDSENISEADTINDVFSGDAISEDISPNEIDLDAGVSPQDIFTDNLLSDETLSNTETFPDETLSEETLSEETGLKNEVFDSEIEEEITDSSLDNIEISEQSQDSSSDEDLNMLMKDLSENENSEQTIQNISEENNNTTDGSDEISLDDWMNENSYNDSTEEFETSSKISEDEIIAEPESAAIVAQENSHIISDKTFAVGEIPIDINETEQVSDNTPLGNLYDPNAKIPGDTLINSPNKRSTSAGSNKAPMIAGILGGAVVLIIMGVVGFFASKMLKAPTMETPQPITDDNVPTSSDNGVSDTNTLNVNKDNVVNMDNNTNALASTATVDTTKKSGSAIPFTDIKKLSWEVPDYVSYDANFRQYFQSVGKSLKLALVSDLLLADDYIYSNPVKISVTFSQDGTFKNSQILNSSGSTKIDSIMLQTVNQTLKSVKAPHSVGKDESTTAILKIYF